METRSRPWRTERVGFGALSGGAGTAVCRDGRPEEAATRAARTELGASHAGGPAEEPDVEIKKRMLTIVQTATAIALKVGLDLEVPH